MTACSAGSRLSEPSISRYAGVIGTSPTSHPESEGLPRLFKGVRQPGLQAIPAVRGLVSAVAGPVVGVKAVRRVGIDNNL